MVGNRPVRFVTLLHRRLSTGPAPHASALVSRPVTLRSHPVLFTATFGVLYTSLWVLTYYPVYGYFYFTDSSTAFLVGRRVTSLLRKPLPFSRDGRTVEDVLDNAMGGFINTGRRLWRKWKGGKADEQEGEEIATDVLEDLDAKRHWIETAQTLKNHLANAKDNAVALQAVPRFLRKWTEERKKEAMGEGDGESKRDEVAREAPEDLQGNESWRETTTQALMNRLVEMKDHAVALQAEPRFWTKWTGRTVGESDESGEDEIARKAPENLQANEHLTETTQMLMNRLAEMKDHAIAAKAGLAEHYVKVSLSADKLREWKDRAIESLPEFDEIIAPKNGTMKAMTDAAAVYLVVTASAPLRLAASLFFTPRVARLWVRRWKAIFRK